MSKALACVSQPPRATSTKVTPCSTSRRAIRQPEPNEPLAVRVAHRGGLVVELEGPGIARVHHPDRLGVDRLVIDGRLAPPLAGRSCPRPGRASAAGAPSASRRLPWGAGGWRSGRSGFCTTNGACAMPRKPAPMPGRVDRDAVRQVEVLEPLAQLVASRPSRSSGARPSGWGPTRCASCRCRGRGCLPSSRASG